MKKYSTLIGLILLIIGSNQIKASQKESGFQDRNLNYQTNYFTTSDGVKLRYLTSGEGPAVIFQPGFMMPAEVFEPQLNLLSKSFRIIVLDPRGQGLSEDSPDDNYVARRARDIYELMEVENITSCILAGWSLGVADVLSFLENFGVDKLNGLVLIDGPISTEGEFIEKAWKDLLHNLQVNRQQMEENFFTSLFNNVHDTLLLNTVRERLRNTPTNSSFVALGTHIMAPKDYSEILESAGIPVLATIAAWTFQLDKYKELDCDIVIEQFKNHTLFIEESERFNKLIMELYEKSLTNDKMH
jgi:microsomal epoxide hydrolase